MRVCVTIVKYVFLGVVLGLTSCAGAQKSPWENDPKMAEFSCPYATKLAREILTWPADKVEGLEDPKDITYWVRQNPKNKEVYLAEFRYKKITLGIYAWHVDSMLIDFFYLKKSVQGASFEEAVAAATGKYFCVQPEEMTEEEVIDQ